MVVDAAIQSPPVLSLLYEPLPDIIPRKKEPFQVTKSVKGLTPLYVVIYVAEDG